MIKKLLIGSFIAFFTVSGNSQADPIQTTIEKLEKNIHDSRVNSTVYSNSYSICSEQHQLVNSPRSESEYKRASNMCILSAQNAATVASGSTDDQLTKEMKRLFKELCSLYKKTNSSQIADFLKRNNDWYDADCFRN